MAICNPRTDHCFKRVEAKLQRPWLVNPLVWHMGPDVPSATSEAMPSSGKQRPVRKQYLMYHFMLVCGQCQKKCVSRKEVIKRERKVLEVKD